jgi:glycosyltransferase involved in cell wall biosynthesis
VNTPRGQPIRCESSYFSNARASMSSEPIKRSILCVAHVFPPVAETGTHRTRAVVRHLPAHGWMPVVVTAEPPPDFSRDEKLLEGLPENLVVYQTKAPIVAAWASRWWSRVRSLWRRTPQGSSGESRPATAATEKKGATGWVEWISAWLQVPDLTIGWLPWGLAAACRAVKRHRCRAIYTSAPPFTTHLIGLLTKCLTRIPWIADFRDPWRANPFRKTPFASVARFDAWLERLVVSKADLIICNSDPLREDFQARYPQRADRFVTIYNGFEPDEFRCLNGIRTLDPQKTVLSHAGFFYGHRRPHQLLHALHLLNNGGSDGSHFVLQLIGTPSYEGEPLASIAKACGVDQAVQIVGAVPHRQSLELLRGSDIQVLVGFEGSGSDLQVPAKLFEYMGLGRPVLALAPEDSAIAKCMASLGPLGELCSPNDPQAIAAGIRRLATRSRDRTTNGADQEALVQFHRRTQISHLARLLDSIV